MPDAISVTTIVTDCMCSCASMAFLTESGTGLVTVITKKVRTRTEVTGT